MKYCLTIFFYFSSIQLSIAQSNISYTDFILQDKSIQWAAEYDQLLEITPVIKKFGIREQLFKQLQKNGCIDDYQLTPSGIIKSKFCKASHYTDSDSFISNKNIYSVDILPFQIYANDFFAKNEMNCSCSTGIQKNKFDVYRIKQVLYYKDARLYVKNVLVTPLCLKSFNEEAQSFCWSSSYSSCFNNGFNILTPELKKKCIDLGNSEVIYNLRNDSLNSSNKILTTFNPLFSHDLYEDIFNNKLTVIDDQNNIIPYNKVRNYRNPAIETPVYNAQNGKLQSVNKTIPEVKTDSFYEYAIHQHFYFDTTNNIVHSEVNFITAYRNIITEQGIFLGRSAYYNIYFITPSLFKKPALKTSFYQYK